MAKQSVKKVVAKTKMFFGGWQKNTSTSEFMVYGKKQKSKGHCKSAPVSVARFDWRRWWRRWTDGCDCHVYSDLGWFGRLTIPVADPEAVRHIGSIWVHKYCTFIRISFFTLILEVRGGVPQLGNRFVSCTRACAQCHIVVRRWTKVISALPFLHLGAARCSLLEGQIRNQMQ